LENRAAGVPDAAVAVCLVPHLAQNAAGILDLILRRVALQERRGVMSEHRKIPEASPTGLDGVLLCWPRYEEGMRQFRDVTYPLIKQAGLRDFS
jgi:hypothetical protein